MSKFFYIFRLIYSFDFLDLVQVTPKTSKDVVFTLSCIPFSNMNLFAVLG